MDRKCLRKCEHCPLVEMQLSAYESIEKAEKSIVEVAVDDEVEEFAEYIHRRVEEAVGEGDYEARPKILTPDGLREIESPEDLAIGMRQGASALSHALLEQMDEIVGEINTITTDCPGPLTMQAQKGGLAVSATICVSPAAPEERSLEVAWVRRSALENQPFKG